MIGEGNGLVDIEWLAWHSGPALLISESYRERWLHILGNDTLRSYNMPLKLSTDVNNGRLFNLTPTDLRQCGSQIPIKVISTEPVERNQDNSFLEREVLYWTSALLYDGCYDGDEYHESNDCGSSI